MMYIYRFHIGSHAGSESIKRFSPIVRFFAQFKRFSRSAVVRAIEQHGKFKGYTVYSTLGLWNGKREKSFVVEYVNDTQITLDFLERVKYQLLQDSIMWSMEEKSVTF